MTRFVGAEFQVNQICGEEQETRKITAEYYADGLKVLLQKYGLATDRIKIKKSKIPLRF